MDVVVEAAEDMGTAAVVMQVVQHQIRIRMEWTPMQMIRIKGAELETVVPNMDEVLVVVRVHCVVDYLGRWRYLPGLHMDLLMHIV